jgi:hypothetical protein
VLFENLTPDDWVLTIREHALRKTLRKFARRQGIRICVHHRQYLQAIIILIPFLFIRPDSRDKGIPQSVGFPSISLFALSDSAWFTGTGRPHSVSSIGPKQVS